MVVITHTVYQHKLQYTQKRDILIQFTRFVIFLLFYYSTWLHIMELQLYNNIFYYIYSILRLGEYLSCELYLLLSCQILRRTKTEKANCNRLSYHLHRDHWKCFALLDYSHISTTRWKEPFSPMTYYSVVFRRSWYHCLCYLSSYDTTRFLCLHFLSH